ncbi:FKBP-type peptidyl-prolyl cis-trans isomerase [Halarcobacter ebronensis]|uniref:Peptidyl-prolyl cis-trans isomerase n=1 Tax=Halarcobacter ebronensis TaxID=1462615 RepID=A0A4Q1AJP2_9BACT|nr:peptidylprolyl isomerase [Halarcobacter ebronensis]QKF81732.1 FKBP-type peptidyl-prolyl cis-trans isomerase [Halarcobacter ebronensis]RXK04590.1 peptidylprolyl isomerase [Halarcobacter ebronensis]
MPIKKNQIVVMNYELKVNNEVIESNLEEGNPIEFVFGLGQILPALEKTVSLMEVGETKVVKIPARDAYGEYDESFTETLPIEEFEDIDLEIGMVLEADDEEDEVVRATVIDVTKEDVTVDYNHPLAGCDLEFKIVIKSVS